jgi:hypothetical protein
VLSSAQLHAGTTIPGTFVYIPAPGTVLSAGSQTLPVTFPPLRDFQGFLEVCLLHGRADEEPKTRSNRFRLIDGVKDAETRRLGRSVQCCTESFTGANDQARRSGNRPAPANEINFQENAQARLN